MLMRDARRKPGTSTTRSGMLNASQKSTNRRASWSVVSSKPASTIGGCHHADRRPRDRERAQDVARPALVDQEHRAVVDDAPDDLEHVVRLRRRVGDDGVETLVLPVDRVVVLHERRGIEVVRRDVTEEATQEREARDPVLPLKVRDAAALRVDVGAAGSSNSRLVRHGLHHVRPGHEHVRGVAHHRDEVGDGRDYTRRQRMAKDRGELRHHAHAITLRRKMVA